MAKAKPSMTNLFEKTEPKAGEPAKKSGKRSPLGLYLKDELFTAMQDIAAENNQTIHGIVTFAVAYFIRQYRAGKVKIETETRQKLKLDL